MVHLHVRVCMPGEDSSETVVCVGAVRTYASERSAAALRATCARAARLCATLVCVLRLRFGCAVRLPGCASAAAQLPVVALPPSETRPFGCWLVEIGRAGDDPGRR